MGRGFRGIPIFTLATLLLAGCASQEEGRRPEGHVVFRAGAAPPGSPRGEVVAGPHLRRLGVLVPAVDPAWQAAWSEPDQKNSRGGGGTAGFLTGLAIVQSVPVFLLAWPAAAGVVAGMTAAGILGEQMDSGSPDNLVVGDRAALLEAAVQIQPDRLLREAAAEALRARTGRLPLPIPWHGAWGPDTPGPDPFAKGRTEGIDGLLDVAVEAFGLAVGDEADTFGPFVRVRARVLETASGALRYERVLEHGPGRPLTGLPRPAAYTVAFLAVDEARVFRQEVKEVLLRMARVLVEDPALPIGPP